MNNKGFLYMIGGVVILGAILGGVFFGGISVGESKCSNPSNSTCSDEDIRAILSSRFGSGQRSLQSNSNASGQGQNEESFGRGLEGMRGLSGPIEALDGDSITISTAQGPLQAVVSNETVIVMTGTGMLEDLAPGIRVRVIGERGDDGIVAATFITIISEEIQGSPFGGFQRSATP